MDMVNKAARLTLMVVVNGDKFNRMRALTNHPLLQSLVYRSAIYRSAGSEVPPASLRRIARKRCWALRR